MSSQRVVVTVPVERIVTVRLGDTVVEVRQPAAPRLQVLTFGYQGPAGTLSDNVLQRVEQIGADAAFARGAADESQQAAATAQAAATEAVTSVNALVRSLQSAFEYHAGAIGVNEE
ncbi:hypothetical protein HAPgp15 [Halomonas phage phiHAP-1]|uniref:Uncharacterized protein n=1 Tax=Halomonas phage phiHAP-1 (isolate -/Gulf of Mexico/-/2001) TaxID=1283337 RepID=B0ZSG3_BPHA1|nr:hypothetical protein HAPgp15 [Halomonas phage phiHAP-1]ABY90383.1 conserved hypothetical protein [Halomonas phage phiHAP-1]